MEVEDFNGARIAEIGICGPTAYLLGHAVSIPDTKERL